jgi:hypothetical protein
VVCQCACGSLTRQIFTTCSSAWATIGCTVEHCAGIAEHIDVDIEIYRFQGRPAFQRVSMAKEGIGPE